MTLGEFISINTFLGGKFGGNKWPDESLLPELKIKRAYCTFGEIWDYNVTEPKLALDWTHKNWGWKDSLKRYKNEFNTKIILATAGGFFKDNQPGDINKKMPINSTDNPYSPGTYKRLADICYDIASIYGKNKSALLHPERFQTTVTGTNPRKATEAIAGQDLIWMMEIMQEGLGWGLGAKPGTTTPIQVWNKVTQVHNPKTFAIGFHECLKAIWQADPDMNVCIGALVHNDPGMFDEFAAEFYALTGYTLKSYPRPGQGEIYAQFHNYIRNAARTKADSPENHQLHLDYWDSGLPYIVGEFGSDTVDNNTNLLTPLLIPGLNIEQMMAELNNRHILWYSSGKNCVAAIPYEIRNEEDLGGQIFRTCGYYKDNSTYGPKAGLPIFQDFIAKTKDFILPATYSKQGEYHVFTYANGVARYKPDGRIEINPTIPIPPQPTTMKAYYSNNPQRTGQVEITSTPVFPVSPFTIEIKDVTGGIEKQLKKDGVVIIARTPESQPPLDVPGTEANGTAKMVNAGAGNYELTVWKNGLPTVWTFKVQTSTPTPIKKPVTSSYIQEGRVYFQTSDSLHSTPVSQS